MSPCREHLLLSCFLRTVLLRETSGVNGSVSHRLGRCRRCLNDVYIVAFVTLCIERAGGTLCLGRLTYEFSAKVPYLQVVGGVGRKRPVRLVPGVPGKSI